MASQHLMGVAAVALAHLLYGSGKQALAIENVGIFGKKAKHQPGHEVVHVMPRARRWPILGCRAAVRRTACSGAQWRARRSGCP